MGGNVLDCEYCMYDKNRTHLVSNFDILIDNLLKLGTQVKQIS